MFFNSSLITIKKGGINAITQAYPNCAKNILFSHIPKTIQDCTEKNTNIMIAAIPKDILDLIDNIETVSINYNSAFLNPHLPKSHFEGQKPVHTPTFSMIMTNITTPHDSNKKPESSTNDIRRYTIRVSVTLFNKFFIYCLHHVYSCKKSNFYSYP